MYVRDKKTGVALITNKTSLDFFSQDSCLVQGKITAYHAYLQMTKNSPVWLQLAFWVRDKVSGIAGIKEIHGFAAKSHETPQIGKVGEKLDFFDIVEISDNELLLTAIDKHLGVLIAIQAQATKNGKTKITVTASVKNKNIFGTLYMMPVRPAHRVIVSNMLKKLKNTHEGRASFANTP